MAERTHVYRRPRFLAHVPSIATIECQRQTEQVAGRYPTHMAVWTFLSTFVFVILNRWSGQLPKDPQNISSAECDLEDKFKRDILEMSHA